MKTFNENDVTDSLAMVSHHIRARLSSGSIPKFMGIEGFMALLHDRVVRWFETRDEDEILQLVSDGFVAFHLARPEFAEPQVRGIGSELTDEEIDAFIAGGERPRPKSIGDSEEVSTVSETRQEPLPVDGELEC